MALNNKLATLGSLDCRGTFEDVIKNKVSKEKGLGFFLPLELSNSLCQNPKKSETYQISELKTIPHF
jgi:hypothetical protein